MHLILIGFLLFSCKTPEPETQDETTDTAQTVPMIQDQTASGYQVWPSVDEEGRYVNYSEEVLIEDLNGDRFPEVISLVAESKNNEMGVRIMDGKIEGKMHVFGAGTSVNGMTDLRWVGGLKVIPEGNTIAATLVDTTTGDIIGPDSGNGVMLKNPAVFLVAKGTHGGAIIYWDGSTYSWMHQE